MYKIPTIETVKYDGDASLESFIILKNANTEI